MKRLLYVVPLALLTGCFLGRRPCLARVLKRSLCLAPVALLAGCFLGAPTVERGPTVGDVADGLRGQDELEPAVAAPTLREVVSAYADVMPKLQNDSARYLVAKRLAELAMMEGAAKVAETAEATAFEAATAAYEKLLANPNVESDRPEIHYQLARAYDAQGDQERLLHHLNRVIETSADDEESLLALEARFRRAEMLFSNGDYAEAARDYAIVADRQSPYRLHSYYMLGWAQFKAGDVANALPSFYRTADMVLRGAPVESLSPAERELLFDAFRVAVIALDDLDGPKSLADSMARYGKPQWQSLLYETLGDWYLKKERFHDSAETWETFVAHNPMDPKAPTLTLRVIDTYREAGFASEIEPRKRAFVERYGRGGEFYATHGAEVFETYADTYMKFLDELAARAHANAQKTKRASDYSVAADWYRRWLLNFPEHARVPETRFLLAETLNESGQVAAAVDEYRAIAREYRNHPKAAEAGYAVIVGLESLAASKPDALVEERIDASLEFAAFYPQDPRASTVQVKVSELLFQQKRYAEAAEASELAMQSWQLGSVWKTAALVSAHSRFEMKDYAAAETRYREVLERTGRKRDVVDRLLAAIFKQSEAAEAAGDTAGAIRHLQRLQQIDPRSKIAIDAKFDVAALYAKMGDMTGSASALAAFRRSNPRDPRSKDVSARLAEMYEKNGNSSLAANELLQLEASSSDIAQKSQALYRAGELYLEGGDLANALEAFRKYANTYPRPFALHMEAMGHLDELYRKARQPDKRRFWLQKRLAAYRQATPGERNDRTRFLAAEASFELALDKKAAFDRIRLRQPIPRSLKAKQTALKSAVDAFEATSQYKVQKFVTGSTFQIASIYQQLAQDLLDSERPKGLNALERDQYEVLLEEQAFPFEEKAIEVFEVNVGRSWKGTYDEWVEESFGALKRLMPARFDRQEVEIAYVQALY
jgi:TolA-binding protein